MPDGPVNALRPLWVLLATALTVVAAGAPGEPVVLTGALAVFAVVLALTAVPLRVALAATVPVTSGPARAAQERALAAGRPRQLHPDAPGHLRPRAPGGCSGTRPLSSRT